MRYLVPLALLSVIASPALGKKDPRPPSAEQRGVIEKALRDQGFIRWSGIRPDDGGWEVDSVWDRQGRRVEVKLHPQTLRVIRRERED